MARPIKKIYGDYNNFGILCDGDWSGDKIFV